MRRPDRARTRRLPGLLPGQPLRWFNSSRADLAFYRPLIAIQVVGDVQPAIDCLNAEHGLRKHLAPDAADVLLRYPWPGNVRELRSAIQRAYILSDGDQVTVDDPGRYRMPSPGHSSADSVNFQVGMSYAEIEREMLLKTLARYGNDKTRTAQALGVSVRTIHNQLNRQGPRDAERSSGQRHDSIA